LLVDLGYFWNQGCLSGGAGYRDTSQWESFSFKSGEIDRLTCVLNVDTNQASLGIEVQDNAWRYLA